MKITAQKGFTLIELLVVITIIALLASLAMPVYSTVTQRGNITKGINNCRQIITAMKVYSSDNSGNYPDSASSSSGTGGSGATTDSNTAFRQLFVQGDLSDERIFGCPASKANPDGNIGTSPGYTEAVKAGENHWAMTGTLTDSSSASYPLVYENPSGQAWNPTWDVKSVGIATVGRVWSGPRIIIGLNDASVSNMKLGTDGTVAPTAGATNNQFTLNTAGGGTTPTVLTAQESSGN